MIPTPDRVVDSLTGLSVGDAFGDQVFLAARRGLSASAGLLPPPWEWPDDTEVACSVVDVLLRSGTSDQSDQDALAALFADRLDAGRRHG